MQASGKIDLLKSHTPLNADGPIMRLILRRDYEKSKEDQLVAGILKGVDDINAVSEKGGAAIPSVPTDVPAAEVQHQEMPGSPASKQTKSMPGHRKEVPLDIIRMFRYCFLNVLYL